MTAAPAIQLAEAAVPSDVDLVVLFGSRAKGSAAPKSDWDLAVLLQPNGPDPLGLYGLDPQLARALDCSSDAVDLVDLETASYLLQRVVAEEGKLLFERRPGLFASFCSRAIRQWADWQRRQVKLSHERAVPQP
jgi:predicted nucleotidyltransferase